MAENKAFSDPSEYISTIEKFPEKIDYTKSLQSVEYYRKTLFEVGGFVSLICCLYSNHSALSIL